MEQRAEDQRVTLQGLAKGYLEAEGYTVTGRPRGLLIGNKAGIGEDSESIYVWVPERHAPAELGAQEGPYLADFEKATASHPSAPKFFLIPSLEGMSADFVRGAKRWHNVNVRVPAQFFDTSFTWEESVEASTAARELRTRGEALLNIRAPQPFQNEETGDAGKDLLETLFTKLRRFGTGKSVHVVIGPAGMGKTHLFTGLFARLHRSFMDDKAAQVLSPRPMPLLPEYLSLADGPTLKSLTRAFLQTDFARPLSPEVFEWRLANGFASWLLDGLDEVIVRDPEFFDYLLEIMTMPESGKPPNILICVRDALLASNENLRDFCSEYSEMVDVYRLTGWDAQAKNHFAGIALPDRANEFLAMLRDRPHLDRLASTPYYAQLLADEFDQGEMGAEYSEVGLVEQALDRLVLREYDKKLISRDSLSESEAREFLEAMAAEDFERGFEGIPVESARQWAQYVLPTDLRPEELDALVQQMTQFAVFMLGSFGHLRFTEEILEQFLIGAYLVGLVENPSALGRSLAARPIPVDWVTLRVVAERVRTKGGITTFLPVVLQCQTNDTAFKNAVQVAALATDDPGALRELPFDRKDLSGLVFDGLDLSGASFRDSDLSETEFRGTQLSSATFDGAILNNTLFDLGGGGSLQDAEMGDLSSFYSIRIGQTLIDNPTRARAWFSKQTGRSGRVVEPCPASQQLRHLFGKFVYPNGQARRAQLDRRAMMRGKRIHNPDEILEAATSRGYLVNEDFRDRVRRPEGNAYSEMVGFVSDLTLSGGLNELLDDVCGIQGCEHVPRSA